jgi:hypothetical protein
LALPVGIGRFSTETTECGDTGTYVYSTIPGFSDACCTGKFKRFPTEKLANWSYTFGEAHGQMAHTCGLYTNCYCTKPQSKHTLTTLHVT